MLNPHTQRRKTELQYKTNPSHSMSASASREGSVTTTATKAGQKRARTDEPSEVQETVVLENVPDTVNSEDPPKSDDDDDWVPEPPIKGFRIEGGFRGGSSHGFAAKTPIANNMGGRGGSRGRGNFRGRGGDRGGFRGRGGGRGFRGRGN